MKKPIIFLVAAIAFAVIIPAAAAETMDTGIQDLQKKWAVANYKTPEEKQDTAFEKLTRQAEALVKKHPKRAEPLIWNAIIVSSHAGAVGGFGALGKVKQARKLLEAAEKIDAGALEGSVYTSLGSLYYQVPGWPIGFGDDNKAEAYLKKALSANPEGIDPNFFYGDFLRDQGRYSEALTYLENALNAPPRPHRAVADEGRHAEAQKALDAVRAGL